MSARIVRRTTEDAAVRRCEGQRLPSADQVADRLIVARATHDRYGARHFSNLLDRILEGAH